MRLFERRFWRQPIVKALLAVTFVLLAFVFKMILEPSIDQESSFLLLYMAIILSAWTSGLLGSLCATFLSALLANYFFVGPSGVVGFGEPGQLLRTVLFVLEGVFISLLSHRLQVVRTRAQISEASAKRNLVLSTQYAEKSRLDTDELEKAVVRERVGREQLATELAERRRVEDELRTSEARLRIATEAMRGLIYDWNLQTREVYRSEGMFPLMGYHPAEAPEDSDWWFSRSHPDDRAALSALGQRILSGETDHSSLEYRMQHRDGHYIWVWDHQRVVSDENGAPLRVIGWTISIDERKRAEERTQQLNVLASALTRAVTANDVIETMLRQVRAEPDATFCAIRILNEARTDLELIGNFGYTEDMLAQWRALPYDDPTALGALAVIENRSIWLQTPEERALLAPIVTGNSEFTAYPALAIVPFNVNDALIGVLVVAYQAEHRFTIGEQNYLEAFTDYFAQALQRARLLEQNRQLAAYEERQRLARELHDAVSQIMFAATSMADALPRLWERDPKHGQARLQEVVTLNRAAMAEMRKLLLELRPEAIVRTPFEVLLDHLSKAVRGAKEITVALHADGLKDVFLPPEVHVACYRIAQETLNNVVKHSGAANLTITMQYDGSVFDLEISDDGDGFDMALVSQGIGMGSMRERAAAVGARLTIVSQPGDGTGVALRWSADIVLTK